MTKDAEGMKGYRPRDENGELRRKRGDTHVGTVENENGVNFNVRSDMHLNTLLDQNNVQSLDQLLHKHNRNK